jgi:hypothetical protein
VDASPVADAPTPDTAGHVPESAERKKTQMSERLVVIAPNWAWRRRVMRCRRSPTFAAITLAAHIAVSGIGPSVAPIYTMVNGVDQVITLPGGAGYARGPVCPKTCGCARSGIVRHRDPVAKFVWLARIACEGEGFASDGDTPATCAAIVDRARSETARRICISARITRR